MIIYTRWDVSIISFDFSNLLYVYHSLIIATFYVSLVSGYSMVAVEKHWKNKVEDNSDATLSQCNKCLGLKSVMFEFSGVIALKPNLGFYPP